MATLVDIAREADVSICTVSRYLNKKIKIRSQTATRIDGAIEKLGYIPNSAARTLKTNTTSNVAVLIPAMDNLLFAENIENAGEIFYKNTFSTFIYTISNDIKREVAIIPVLVENRVRGVIFNTLPTNYQNFSHLDLLLKNHIPFVFVNRLFSPGKYPSVCVDYRSGVASVIDHLAASGRRRIGLIIGRKRQPQSSENLAGYMIGMERNGLQWSENIVFEAEYDPELVVKETELLINEKVDAIYCITDLLAIHVIERLKEMGIGIPDDIAVIGAGNTRFSTIIEPKLTTLDIKNPLLGRYSAELLLKMIREEPYEPIIVLEPELVVRESGG